MLPRTIVLSLRGLALEVAADGREGELAALSLVGRGRSVESDQMPSVRDRKTSAIRRGSAPGSAWSSWFWSREGRPARHWPRTIFWMPRMRSCIGKSTSRRRNAVAAPVRSTARSPACGARPART